LLFLRVLLYLLMVYLNFIFVFIIFIFFAGPAIHVCRHCHGLFKVSFVFLLAFAGSEWLLLHTS